MLPFIRSFQDNMMSWMSTLISQQDGCMPMVAQQVSMGRLRQKHLEQTATMRTPRGPSPDRDQIQYLRDQLAHREVQLEQTLGQNEILILSKKKNHLHRCAYSAVKQKSGNRE